MTTEMRKNAQIDYTELDQHQKMVTALDMIYCLRRSKTSGIGRINGYKEMINNANGYAVTAAQSIVRDLTGYNIKKEVVAIYVDALKELVRGKTAVREDIKEDIRNDKWRAQGCSCAMCNRKLNFSEVVLDHIIPFKLVRETLGLANRQILCKECNDAKGDNYNALTIGAYVMNRMLDAEEVCI